MSAVDPAKKDRFVNESGGWLGAVVRAPGTATGFKGISLYPRQEIDLDIEEQAMTANAPRDPRANPLANGNLKVIAEGMDFAGRRPLRPDPNLATADPTNPATWNEEQRAKVASFPDEDAQRALAETGIAVDPGQQPAVGEYKLFEETGTAPDQPPVVGGGTIMGEVETAADGEPAPQPQAPPQPESEELGPADRVGHVPGRSRGKQTPTPVTATP